MANTIRNLQKQKVIYNNIKNVIPNQITKLQNILDDLNNKENFNGNENVNKAIKEIEKAISDLHNTKNNLQTTIDNLVNEIKRLEILEANKKRNDSLESGEMYE